MMIKKLFHKDLAAAGLKFKKKNHIKACGFINQLFKINCALVKYIISMKNRAL